ncbi:hypothetical protein EDI_066640 [Entamoeba dispar SAW760]|uniref:Nucleosome assembly protein n=1 Tax=Entamoeba dispar (strain ATCC PRA-260 / SAW760) TaxID=370354 RepID=B0EAW5_ENTDS|nr:uncharacterized protein EDI_066640 [Entamoeba dispar SAW760]EDR28333.1 hypothetical protein EDI_066640 [Entamoeba dispar SAW760]|eukprot:EDR28333.1 hypothetical protein EDI_066640 [Entamoeba dispar SAW760]
MDVSPSDNYVKYIETASPELITKIKKAEHLQLMVDEDELENEIRNWKAFVRFMEENQKILQQIGPKINIIPGFWYTVLHNAGLFDYYATNPTDVKILQFLYSISCHSFSYQIVPYPGSTNKKTLRVSFVLSFTFKQNPYLLYNTLTKKVTYLERHLNGPPTIVNSGVFFNEGQDPHKINGVIVGSFFDYFVPYNLKDFYEDATEEETINNMLEKDFTVTETLIRTILNNCIECYQNKREIIFD